MQKSGYEESQLFSLGMPVIGGEVVLGIDSSTYC